MGFLISLNSPRSNSARSTLSSGLPASGSARRTSSCARSFACSPRVRVRTASRTLCSVVFFISLSSLRHPCPHDTTAGSAPDHLRQPHRVRAEDLRVLLQPLELRLLAVSVEERNVRAADGRFALRQSPNPHHPARAPAVIRHREVTLSGGLSFPAAERSEAGVRRRPGVAAPKENSHALFHLPHVAFPFGGRAQS